MLYLIVISGLLLLLFGFAISFCIYVRDRRRHSRPSSCKRRKPRKIPSYQLYAWIDDEVAKNKLYRKPDLSEVELADELGMDVWQLRSVISKAYDKSVSEYLNERRVQAACNLLLESSNMTLDEISFEAGFASLNTFKSVFKEAIGLTPDKYRDQMIQSGTNKPSCERV